MVVLSPREPYSAPTRRTRWTCRSTRSAIQILLTLGVSMILFHGGLGLSFGVLRPVLLGLGLLAFPES